jgi:hypothetical protein
MDRLFFWGETGHASAVYSPFPMSSVHRYLNAEVGCVHFLGNFSGLLLEIFNLVGNEDWSASNLK